MTADNVRDMLRKAANKAGGIRAWARERNLSAAYVSDVVAGRREPGPSICEAFGLEAVRETTYRRVRQ